MTTLESPYTKGRFNGKVSIITGGASGIGRATVERFVSDGAAVAVFDVNQSAGEQFVTELKDAGHYVSFYKVDVSVKKQCLQAVEKAADEHGGTIHFLVNCAGIVLPCKVLDTSDEDWDKLLGVNVKGYSNMVQACHPFMKKAGKWECAVVNISSIAAHRANPALLMTYHASKGAVVAMTKCMALELSADGIRVNSISPGMIWTGMMEKAIGGDRKNVEPAISKFKMQRRFGEPTEVAAVIAFLCSKDASYMTGTDLAVDGGYLALGPEGVTYDKKIVPF